MGIYQYSHKGAPAYCHQCSHLGLHLAGVNSVVSVRQLGSRHLLVKENCLRHSPGTLAEVPVFL